MSQFFLIWHPKAQETNHPYIVSLIFLNKIRVKRSSFYICADTSHFLNLCCLPSCTESPNQVFLNIDEFFSLSGPTVPFILGQLGIPIFGNKVIPRWLWHTPTNHFFSLFLSQAENDLPPHGQRFTGTEPGPLIEERTWLCSLLLPPSLSVFLSSLRFLCSFLLLTIPPIHF